MKKENWLLCPICDSKTRIKLRTDTILTNFPLFCPSNITMTLNYYAHATSDSAVAEMERLIA